MAITGCCRVDLVLECGESFLRKPPVHPAVCQITAAESGPLNKIQFPNCESEKSCEGDDSQKINGARKKKKGEEEEEGSRLTCATQY